MKEIALSGRKSDGLVALVDDDLFDTLKVYRWYALRVKGSRTIYARTVVNGCTLYMHHLVQPVSDGFEVDHRDRDGLNNQRANLRVVTHAVNASNATPVAGVNHVHATTSRGRTYYYPRPTRTRLPDDPTSPQFAEILKRLNAEHGLYNIVQPSPNSSIKST